MSQNAALPATLRAFERGGLSSNNVLFFDDRASAPIVDTGYATQVKQTMALVESELRGQRLARIVNTHLHSDHCGGNAALKGRFGAQILIPLSMAAAVAVWDEGALTFAAAGQVCDRFAFDALLASGERIRLGGGDWQIIAALGDDPHSLILWSAAHRILISADVLWQHGFGAIFPEIEGGSGFAEQRAMLDAIAGLQPRVVIPPGHGAPFTNVREALARANARLDALAKSPKRNARHVARVLIKFYQVLPAAGAFSHVRGAARASRTNAIFPSDARALVRRAAVRGNGHACVAGTRGDPRGRSGRRCRVQHELSNRLLRSREDCVASGLLARRMQPQGRDISSG